LFFERGRQTIILKMGYKVKKIALLIMSFLVSGYTLAQGAKKENYFDGIYGQVEVGFGSLTNKTTLAPSIAPLSVDSSFGSTNLQSAITLGYSREIVDFVGTDYDINLAANISYNFTNGNSGNQTFNILGNSVGFSTTTKNILAFSVEPGYYLSRDSILYAKLGYAQGQTNYQNTISNVNVNIGTQSGPLFGFGFKHGFNEVHPNVYWGIEAYQINFRAKTANFNSPALGDSPVAITSKPTLLFGKIHLGYIF
jgi:outer membrane immunogenic protein